MDYTKILRWALIIGLCLVPFTSLIVADGTHFVANWFFPYITGKNFTFRILIEVLLALYVLLAIRVPKYRPHSSTLMWAVGLLVAWLALATIFSVDPIKSFWSNFERMDGYITTIHLFALFVISGAVLTAEDWWEKFFNVSVAVSLIQGVYALLQAFKLFGLAPSSQSGARADTTFGNATYLAVFMLFNFFITLYLMFRKSQPENRNQGLPYMTAQTLYAISLLLQFLGVYYTESRGPLLGLVGGVFIAAAYIALRGHSGKLKKYSTWGVGVIVVLALVFIGIKNSPLVQKSNTLSRLASISLVDKTTQARFLIWGEAWQGFKASPKTVALGWGQENFNFVFNKYYNPQMYDQEQWFDRAHNQFIDMTLDGGLPAGLLYIALFILAAWAIVKSNLTIPEQSVLLGLLAGYAFNNLFVFDNLLSYVYFFALLAFLHGHSKKEPHGWMFMSKPLGDRALAVAAPIVLVVLIWGGYELNGPGIARASMLINALTPVNTQTGAAKDPSENLAEFKTALGMGQLGYQETVEQLFQFTSNNIAPSTTASPDLKQQAYTLTTQAGDNLLNQRKGDARLELFYGVFLDQFSQFPQAIQHLNNALANSPGKQQILFEIGATYLAQGNNKDALPPLKQAYDETPQYDQAILYYATALYYNGDNTDADALLTKQYGNVYVDQQQILQAYFATKQYGRLEQIYANRVAADPTDLQSQVAEAILGYFTSGSKTAAINKLEALIKANPSVASQIQSYVDQINNGTLKP